MNYFIGLFPYHYALMFSNFWGESMNYVSLEVNHVYNNLIKCIRNMLQANFNEPLFPRYVCIVQYIPRNMHTIFALLCFVVVIHWLIFLYPSGLLHWHCGNLTIAPVPAEQPWWIWINTSCEFIMNDCITTTKQSTTKPCAYFLGYTVCVHCNLYVLHIETWVHIWVRFADKIILIATSKCNCKQFSDHNRCHKR